MQSARQSRGVPTDVIFHECRYEVIAVVITNLATEHQWDAGLSASVLQKLGAQLPGQELVGVAIVNQEIRKARAILDQRDSVMLAPGCAGFTEIPAQRLDSPRHL